MVVQRHTGLPWTSPSRSVTREPLFQTARPAEPVPQDVPEISPFLTHGGLIGAPITAVSLFMLTNGHSLGILMLSGLAGGLTWIASLCLADHLESKLRQKHLANEVDARAYQNACQHYEKSSASSRPLSPWPKLQSLVGQQAALKTLLSGPESAALTLALDNLEQHGVRLGKAPGQILECSPDKLGTHALLPKGRRVPVDSVKDLRRLDLAYGHSDPTPFSNALNSFLDRDCSVTESLQILPDSQSTQTRYEAFQRLEFDQPGKLERWGVRLDLHKDVVAQEYFLGSGQDYGLDNPQMAQTLKDLYAQGWSVFPRVQGEECKAGSPLDAYRALESGCRASLARSSQKDTHYGLGVPLTNNPARDIERFVAWESAIRTHQPNSHSWTGLVHALEAMESPEFTPAVLTSNLARLQTCVRSGFSQDLIDPLKLLRAECQTAEELNQLVSAFLAQPRWVEKDRMFSPRDDFERHMTTTLNRVLTDHRARRDVISLAPTPGNGLQRGIQKLGNMLMVGGTRLRSREA